MVLAGARGGEAFDCSVSDDDRTSDSDEFLSSGSVSLSRGVNRKQGQCVAQKKCLPQLNGRVQKSEYRRVATTVGRSYTLEEIKEIVNRMFHKTHPSTHTQNNNRLVSFSGCITGTGAANRFDNWIAIASGLV